VIGRVDEASYHRKNWESRGKCGFPEECRARHMRVLETIGLLGLTLFCASLRAQSPNDAAATSTGSRPAIPTVTFSLDFPGSVPDHYALQIGSDGHASYESTSRISSESDDEDSFHFDFIASPATRKKIFDLAARAKYFQEPLDSHKRHIASTGTKTLSYRDSQRSTKGTYNYSLISAVEDLTSIFQSMSTTLEFGRRLQYDHHYQKLALDEELKRMEDMAESGNLQELQAVAPILNQIVSDSSVINVVRARAQRLLAMAGTK
jgi:hypothetical protein